MNNLDIISSFEQSKNRILNKIQKTKEEWQRVWREAQGNPAAETQLIHAKLEIQIMEAEALEELAKLEEKIKGFTENLLTF